MTVMRLLLAGRVLLLVLAGAALVLSASRPRDRGDRYACPMHPAVRGTWPGDCPICGMKLQTMGPHPAGPGVATPGTGTATALMLVLSSEQPELPRHDTPAAIRRRSTIRVRGISWLEGPCTGVARLYREEAAVLRRGDVGTFWPADGSGMSSDVRLTAVAPSSASAGAVSDAVSDAVSEVRFERSCPAGARRSGPAPLLGTLDLGDRTIDVLVIPAEAILESAQGPFVLVASPEGRAFTRRSLRLGRVVAGQAIVQAGLQEHEHVVAMGAFFVEAERRRLGGGGP
jgi:hypothetical protein